ncbi:hypothetical protein I4U23_011922 [Adineta vaga]|nr:hypothetical protein I4U23_011922 [Adineta vaga]
MASTFNFLLIFNTFIISIKSSIDSNSVIYRQDEHAHELPSYRYSQQGNTMNDSILSDNSIILLFHLILMITIFLLIPLMIILRQCQSILPIFLSFTAGGLIADVFLRILPNVILFYKNSLETPNQHDNRAGLFVLIGIFLSLVIEKYLRHLQRNHESQTNPTSSNTIVSILFLLSTILYTLKNNLKLSSILMKNSIFDSTLMITNIIYDVLHVFYGYTILIYCGWTFTKAMRYQLLTRLTSLIICLINLQSQSNIITRIISYHIFLPLTAGLFIYITTVHIMPELIVNTQRIKGTVLRVHAFTISILIVFCLKQYE